MYNSIKKKKRKHFGIYLTNDMQDPYTENYKALLTDIKTEVNKEIHLFH